MTFKQSTFGELLDSEHEMVLRAEERFGDYFANAFLASELLAHFVKSVGADRWTFLALLSHGRKHHVLALLSTVRLHRIQAGMNLRQALEAGASAAYAVANPNSADFATIDEDGLADTSQKLTTKQYKWLDHNFLKKSETIKQLKANINELTSHANIISAYSVFDFDDEHKRPVTPFFDFKNDFLVKSDLWLIANVGMGLMDLFYEVNVGVNAIVFADDFRSRMRDLGAENDRLKWQMMESDRYQALSVLVDKRNKRLGRSPRK